MADDTRRPAPQPPNVTAVAAMLLVEALMIRLEQKGLLTEADRRAILDQAASIGRDPAAGDIGRRAADRIERLFPLRATG